MGFYCILRTEIRQIEIRQITIDWCHESLNMNRENKKKKTRKKKGMPQNTYVNFTVTHKNKNLLVGEKQKGILPLKRFRFLTNLNT